MVYIPIVKIQILKELYFVSRYLTNLNKREIALHFRRGIIWQKCREKFRRPSKLFGQSGAQIPQEDSYARSTTIIAQQFEKRRVLNFHNDQNERISFKNQPFLTENQSSWGIWAPLWPNNFLGLRNFYQHFCQCSILPTHCYVHTK